MSSSKGNTQRQRPQKHQNRTVFKNNLHDTSNKTKFLNSLEVSGVCKRCKDIIDWKIKYKKYKTLTAPTKCVGCQQKTVKYAYHVLCRICAKEKHVCAKCMKAEEVIPESQNDGNNVDLTSMLKTLPERKRRTVLRYINKHHGSDQNIPSESMSFIEEIIAKMEKATFDCEDDEFCFSSDEDSKSEDK